MIIIGKNFCQRRGPASAADDAKLHEQCFVGECRKIAVSNEL
jgi:hypothetical protein